MIDLTSVVALVCRNLTNEELAVLHLIALTDGDPHGRLFDYKTVAPLFTDANGTRMHQMTKDALDRVVAQRLGGVS